MENSTETSQIPPRLIRKQRRRSCLPYLLLNVLISALTTLVVLWLWSRSHGIDSLADLAEMSGKESNPSIIASPTPVPPLPSLDQPVIQIKNVFGMGDLENEVIVLQRVGDEVEVWMNDWVVSDEDGNRYTIEGLVLNRDAELQLFTRAGFNTASQLYWNLNQPVWRSGEKISVIDSQGNLRAVYQIP